jgi:predicted homoserine dehydrogenase-like protein
MYYHRLRELEETGNNIQVGLIGAGTFGAQITSQMAAATGMRLAAIAELEPPKAVRAYGLGGIEAHQVIAAQTPDAIDDVIASGRYAVTRSAQALVESGVDVVIEATGNVEVGAGHARATIAAGKHVVMVTVEADVVVGCQLKKLADEAGVLYSAAYGDEPAIALGLWDWARSLGFRVVAAGKGTRFRTSFRRANPDDVPKMYGFTGDDYNAQMFGSFLDGTKHAIEMACLANMSGLVPDIRGMHFPCSDLRGIPDTLCHRDKGGVLGQEGIVEAVSSIDENEMEVERSLRGGLYCVVDGPSDFTAESLGSYGEIIGMITGKRSNYSMIYRPQHWIGHEMPITVAAIMLDSETCGTPMGQHAEVISAAKKPLAAGITLDGEGGYCLYGLLEKATIARVENLLPVGLSRGAILTHDIPEDGVVTYDDVQLAESPALELRQLQDHDLGAAEEEAAGP